VFKKEKRKTLAANLGEGTVARLEALLSRARVTLETAGVGWKDISSPTVGSSPSAICRVFEALVGNIMMAPNLTAGEKSELLNDGAAELERRLVKLIQADAEIERFISAAIRSFGKQVRTQPERAGRAAEVLRVRITALIDDEGNRRPDASLRMLLFAPRPQRALIDLIPGGDA